MSCSFCNERFSKSNKLIHECGKRESICGDRYEMLREEMYEKSNRRKSILKPDDISLFFHIFSIEHVMANSGFFKTGVCV